LARNLVLIVAYEAEPHISGVLSRFSSGVWNHPDWEILCIDDASSDGTARLADSWRQERAIKNLKILRNPINQGYGGNQKLGYRYAIDNGFDRVILIHGDGQYAPERVVGIADLMAKDGADVYLGVRTWSYWNARSGGMPRYKYFGNKVLTWAQNILTGQKLTEYHTGLRGYSVPFLRDLPFDLNSNDFHFDTEILLQAFHVEATITQQPIEARYGDEVCRVNGIAYAVRVFFSTLHYALIRAGFLNSPQYRRGKRQRYQDKTQSSWSSHGRALKEVFSLSPKSVLDVGCGNGHVARRLQEAGIEVHGIDRDDFSNSIAWKSFTKLDLETDGFALDASKFDVICCLDVIEHLKRPEEFLIQIRESQRSSHAPILLLCTPNVAFLSVRIALLFGFFNYSDRGILDLDHHRLFSRASFVRAISNAGYDIMGVIPIPAPWDFVIRGRLGKMIVRIHALLAKVWPSGFAFQILVKCRPRTNLHVLLQSAESFDNSGS
jgi:glycosyltransferase involved in cell wall biosynthesis